ncbi:MAG: hypothetical protein PHS88_01675 [Candidatus Omnitrophica bacterium]|nr:hypothetical protein [Candidatus Omnitrophota bacterium]
MKTLSKNRWSKAVVFLVVLTMVVTQVVPYGLAEDLAPIPENGALSVPTRPVEEVVIPEPSPLDSLEGAHEAFFADKSPLKVVVSSDIQEKSSEETKELVDVVTNASQDETQTQEPTVYQENDGYPEDQVKVMVVRNLSETFGVSEDKLKELMSDITIFGDPIDGFSNGTLHLNAGSMGNGRLINPEGSMDQLGVNYQSVLPSEVSFQLISLEDGEYQIETGQMVWSPAMDEPTGQMPWYYRLVTADITYDGDGHIAVVDWSESNESGYWHIGRDVYFHGEIDGTGEVTMVRGLYVEPSYDFDGDIVDILYLTMQKVDGQHYYTTKIEKSDGSETTELSYIIGIEACLEGDVDCQSSPETQADLHSVVRTSNDGLDFLSETTYNGDGTWSVNLGDGEPAFIFQVNPFDVEGLLAEIRKIEQEHAAARAIQIAMLNELSHSFGLDREKLVGWWKEGLLKLHADQMYFGSFGWADFDPSLQGVEIKNSLVNLLGTLKVPSRVSFSFDPTDADNDGRADLRLIDAQAYYNSGKPLYDVDGTILPIQWIAIGYDERGVINHVRLLDGPEYVCMGPGCGVPGKVIKEIHYNWYLPCTGEICIQGFRQDMADITYPSDGREITRRSVTLNSGGWIYDGAPEGAVLLVEDVGPGMDDMYGYYEEKFLASSKFVYARRDSGYPCLPGPEGCAQGPLYLSRIERMAAQGNSLSAIEVFDGGPIAIIGGNARIVLPTGEEEVITFQDIDGLLDEAMRFEKERVSQEVKTVVINDLVASYGIPRDTLEQWFKQKWVKMHVDLSTRQIFVSFAQEVQGMRFSGSLVDPLGEFIVPTEMRLTYGYKDPWFYEPIDLPIYNLNDQSEPTDLSVDSGLIIREMKPWPIFRQMIIQSADIVYRGDQFGPVFEPDSMIMPEHRHYKISYNDNGMIQRVVITRRSHLCDTWGGGECPMQESLLKEIEIQRSSDLQVCHGPVCADVYIMPYLRADIRYGQPEDGVVRRIVEYNVMNFRSNVPLNQIERISEYEKNAAGEDVLTATYNYEYEPMSLDWPPMYLNDGLNQTEESVAAFDPERYPIEDLIQLDYPRQLVRIVKRDASGSEILTIEMNPLIRRIPYELADLDVQKLDARDLEELQQLEDKSLDLSGTIRYLGKYALIRLATGESQGVFYKTQEELFLLAKKFQDEVPPFVRQVRNETINLLVTAYGMNESEIRSWMDSGLLSIDVKKDETTGEVKAQLLFAPELQGRRFANSKVDPLGGGFTVPATMVVTLKAIVTSTPPPYLVVEQPDALPVDGSTEITDEGMTEIYKLAPMWTETLYVRYIPESVLVIYNAGDVKDQYDYIRVEHDFQGNVTVASFFRGDPYVRCAKGERCVSDPVKTVEILRMMPTCGGPGVTCDWYIQPVEEVSAVIHYMNPRDGITQRIVRYEDGRFEKYAPAEGIRSVEEFAIVDGVEQLVMTNYYEYDYIWPTYYDRNIIRADVNNDGMISELDLTADVGQDGVVSDLDKQRLKEVLSWYYSGQLARIRRVNPQGQEVSVIDMHPYWLEYDLNQDGIVDLKDLNLSQEQVDGADLNFDGVADLYDSNMDGVVDGRDLDVIHIFPRNHAVIRLSDSGEEMGVFYKNYEDLLAQARKFELNNESVQRARQVVITDLAVTFGLDEDRVQDMVAQGLLKIKIDLRNLQATVTFTTKKNVDFLYGPAALVDALDLKELPETIQYKLNRDPVELVLCAQGAYCQTPAPTYGLRSAEFRLGNMQYELDYMACENHGDMHACPVNSDNKLDVVKITPAPICENGLCSEGPSIGKKIHFTWTTEDGQEIVWADYDQIGVQGGLDVKVKFERMGNHNYYIREVVETPQGVAPGAAPVVKSVFDYALAGWCESSGKCGVDVQLVSINRSDEIGTISDIFDFSANWETREISYRATIFTVWGASDQIIFASFRDLLQEARRFEAKSLNELVEAARRLAEGIEVVFPDVSIFDLNGDDVLDLKDMQLFQRAIAFAELGVTPAQILKGDINGDGETDDKDYALFKESFHVWPKLDINGDGTVNEDDAAAYLNALDAASQVYVENGRRNIVIRNMSYLVRQNSDGTFTLNHEDMFFRSDAEGRIALHGVEYRMTVNAEGLIEVRNIQGELAVDLNGDGESNLEDVKYLRLMMSAHVDFDGDFDVDNDDIAIFHRVLQLPQYELTAGQFAMADFDHNGEVNQADLDKLMSVLYAVPGDVNLDGAVNGDDIQLVQTGYDAALFAFARLPEEIASVLDFNHDGEFDIKDRDMIIQKIEEIIFLVKETAKFAKMLMNAFDGNGVPGDVNGDGVTDEIDKITVEQGYAFALDILKALPAEVRDLLDFNKDGVVGKEDRDLAIQKIDDLLGPVILRTVSFGSTAQVAIVREGGKLWARVQSKTYVYEQGLRKPVFKTLVEFEIVKFTVDNPLTVKTADGKEITFDSKKATYTVTEFVPSPVYDNERLRKQTTVRLSGKLLLATIEVLEKQNAMGVYALVQRISRTFNSTTGKKVSETIESRVENGKSMSVRLVFNTREEISSAAVVVRNANGTIAFNRKLTQVGKPELENGTGLLTKLTGKISAYSGAVITVTRSDIQVMQWMSQKRVPVLQPVKTNLTLAANNSVKATLSGVATVATAQKQALTLSKK